MRPRDPLASPESLIRRVYAYVAYCIGDGPDAEDVTSAVFERAVRYRHGYDASKGEPVSWLIGIARRCLAEVRWPAAVALEEGPEPADPLDLEESMLQRVLVATAVARLSERDRELVALRFGADLSARQIGDRLGLTTNAVEVALHRVLGRLRQLLTEEEPPHAELPTERTVEIEMRGA